MPLPMHHMDVQHSSVGKLQQPAAVAVQRLTHAGPLLKSQWSPGATLPTCLPRASILATLAGSAPPAVAMLACSALISATRGSMMDWPALERLRGRGACTGCHGRWSDR
jgi:hypothetical protein